MKYLVDTDWVVDFLKGREQAVKTLTALASDGLAVSLVTYGEIYEGVYSGYDSEKQEQAFLAFLRGVDVLPLDQEIMKEFARIRGKLRSQGQIIGDPDILIAATAIHHDLTLLTNNIRHFSRIADLQLHRAN